MGLPCHYKDDIKLHLIELMKIKEIINDSFIKVKSVIKPFKQLRTFQTDHGYF